VITAQKLTEVSNVRVHSSGSMG